jgi:hypothetical protein
MSWAIVNKPSVTVGDPADGKPPELDAEQEDQHDPHPVDRRALPDQREDPSRQVEQRVPADGSEDADRDGDHDRKGERRKSEFDGRRDALEGKPERRLAVAQRVSEIAMQRRPRKTAELDPERAVETLIVAEFSDLLRRRFRRHHHRRRIAG